MPPPVPEQFTDEAEQTLWRDIARLQEDYQGGNESFLRVVNDIIGTLTPSDQSPLGEPYGAKAVETLSRASVGQLEEALKIARKREVEAEE